jgi:hypothetical protein
LDRRLGGHQSPFGGYGEEKNLAPARNRTQAIQHIAIQTELSRLFLYTVHDENHLRVPVGNKISANFVFPLNSVRIGKTKRSCSYDCNVYQLNMICIKILSDRPVGKDIMVILFPSEI